MDCYKKALNTLEWTTVLEHLAKFASSERGRHKCLEAPLYTDVKKIRAEQTLTSEAKCLLDFLLMPPLDGIYDVFESVSTLKVTAFLTNKELTEIAKTIRASRLMKSFLNQNSEKCPNLRQFCSFLFENRELEEDILSKFSDDLEMKEDASPELLNLYRSLRSQNANLRTKLNDVITSPSISKCLQEATFTMRNDRYVLPVKVEHKAHVKGIVHDVSSSGATVFIEPQELVALNNLIKETELRINAEVKRILSELTLSITPFRDEILQTLETLAEIDFIFARAKYSIRLKASEPLINEGRYISLKSVKHPILMTIIQNVVPNDILLGKDFNTLIITGSNTGGKTVTLKTIGLSVLFARAGLHIPAVEADIYPFRKIFADIGDEQSVIQSLSTFSGHIKNIKEIVDNSDNNSLVILDELGAGTDPAEGSSLAQSILEFLSNKNARTIISTHYGELKTLAFVKKGFQNACVEFDSKTISPTYKLITGMPGKSNALDIAKNLGLNPEIVNQAKDIHFNIKDSTASVLDGLQKIQSELNEKNRMAEELKKESEELKISYDKKLQDLNENKKKALAAYKKKFSSELDSARSEIKEILREIYNTKSEKLIRRASNRLNDAENIVRGQFQEADEEFSPTYQKLDWSQIKKGDTVLIKDLNQTAVIVELPDKNGNVQVQMGLMKTYVNKDKIAFTSKKSDKIDSHKKSGVSFRRKDVSSTLDLRGYRVEDALDSLDKYLDDASYAGLYQVCIIHGHGSGALKKALRDYFSASAYVSKFRPGEDSEGGDGVSVLDLN